MPFSEVPEALGNADPTMGLHVASLQARYGSAAVLSDVNLSVSRGELVGLCGRNGAGKTTTMRAISGLLNRSGHLSLDGRALSASPVQVARAGIAHVPEGRRLVSDLSVEENLRIGAVAVGRSPDPARLEAVYELFPKIADIRRQAAGTLSGGEQQMVAIGRGFMAHPQIVMIDELSLGLAPNLFSRLLCGLQDIVSAWNVGILVVDQNVRSLLQTCGRVYVLAHGRSEVIDPEGSDSLLREAYFG